MQPLLPPEECRESLRIEEFPSVQILGIDPGTTVFAWCLFDPDNCKILHAMQDKFDSKKEPLADVRNLWIERLWRERFGGIYRDVDLVAIERMFSTQNGADAPLAVCSHYVWRICHELALPLEEYSVSTVRKLTVGKGNAKKAEVRPWVSRTFGDVYAKSADIADAIAVAVAASIEHGYSPPGPRFLLPQK